MQERVFGLLDAKVVADVVGNCEEEVVGIKVRFTVREPDGIPISTHVGVLVWTPVRKLVGISGGVFAGDRVGRVEGIVVEAVAALIHGNVDGIIVGLLVGTSVGKVVGEGDENRDGRLLGIVVEVDVGDSVGLSVG